MPAGDAKMLQNAEFPLSLSEYELGGEAGRGFSATVYKALCKPLGIEVAIKKFDLENREVNLDHLMSEATTMKGAKHPNILSVSCFRLV